MRQDQGARLQGRNRPLTETLWAWENVLLTDIVLPSRSGCHWPPREAIGDSRVWVQRILLALQLGVGTSRLTDTALKLQRVTRIGDGIDTTWGLTNQRRGEEVTCYSVTDDAIPAKGAGLTRLCGHCGVAPRPGETAKRRRWYAERPHVGGGVRAIS